MEKPYCTQEDIDRVADVLWWIKGAMASAGSTDFDRRHVYALDNLMGCGREVMAHLISVGELGKDGYKKEK